ncbi:MAG: hypothetical protein GF331_06605 [Chitinivibrionales bacterium]|nr:hypothetical protein [Chitinivibrionales bacterium]
MRYCTCCTAQSFSDSTWRAAYDELHRGLRIPPLPPGETPLPAMIDFYWKHLWKDNAQSIGKRFCQPDNLRETHKIWEYVQMLAMVREALGSLDNARLLSLGAGVESPLYAFARLGAAVVATDRYWSRRYWHREYVPYLKTDSNVFNPYDSAVRPIAFVNLNLRFRSPRDWLTWARLGRFDAVYSISSLEHVYGTNRRSSRATDKGIMRRKSALFRRISHRIRPGGALCFTTEVITQWRKRRRLDFYTVDELERIIDTLRQCGLSLVEPVDWETLHEQQLPTHRVDGQYHTAVALAFRKEPGATAET